MVRERRATAKMCVGCPCYMTGEFVGLMAFVSSKSCSSLFCALLCYPCACTYTYMNQVHARTYTYMHACVHTHRHIHTHTHRHTHTHTHDVHNYLLPGVSCNECHINTATCQCVKCDCVMCRPCFDKVRTLYCVMCRPCFDKVRTLYCVVCRPCFEELRTL